MARKELYTADATYVFCRYWPGFTRHFPVDRFNALDEIQLRRELFAAVQAEGPSNKAIEEWCINLARLSRRGSAESGRPNLYRRPPTTPLLEEWLQTTGRELRSYFDRDRACPLNAEDDALLHTKLRLMGWYERRIWFWHELTRHLLVTASTEQIAGNLVNALQAQYCNDQSQPHFGMLLRRQLDASQRAVCDDRIRDAHKHSSDLANQFPLTCLVRKAQSLLANLEAAARGILRGRPRIEGKEATARGRLLAKWKEYFAAGGHKKDFCDENGVKLADLDKAISWERKRRLNRDN